MLTLGWEERMRVFGLHLRLKFGLLTLPALLSLETSACSSEAPGHEQIGNTSAAVHLTSTSTCGVDWTKIDYDQPDADGKEFIELKVTGSPGPGTTLANCGLKSIVLINSDNCMSYRTIDVAATAIPGDGYIEICASGAFPRCDVVIANPP